jgi:outer membrane receptor protein involved in Fe transport
VQYTGDRFSDPENNQILPSFYQLDAGVSVTVADRIRLQVTGNNLTDELGLTEQNPRIIGGQGQGVILARPILGRSFRFSAAVEF